MFTGIVQAIGEITAVARQGRDSRLTVAFRDLDCADVRIGDSIAMNGACMTVVALTPLSFQVDMSQESLQRTTRLDQIGPVNLEKAMSASDRFGGQDLVTPWNSLFVSNVEGSTRISLRIEINKKDL